MTTQEKLHAVETAIRQALPRLLELTEGCYFIDKTFGNRKVKFLHKCQRDDKEYILDEDGIVCWYDYYDKEIIGHDILLSDVLEWLKELELSNEIDTFNIGYSEMGQFVILYDSKYYFWNLSKPYLKDQSEDFIEFLYNLIEK